MQIMVLIRSISMKFQGTPILESSQFELAASFESGNEEGVICLGKQGNMLIGEASRFRRDDKARRKFSSTTKKVAGQLCT